MLIEGLAGVALGLFLLRFSLRAARRGGLMTASFWQTFPQYARFRLKRLWSLPIGLGGAILLIWGLALLYGWLRGYYAARLGHPLP